MSQRIVHGFKIIHIQIQHRKVFIITISMGESQDDAVIDHVAVGQAGQRIKKCHALDFGFHLPKLSQIPDNG